MQLPDFFPISSLYDPGEIGGVVIYKMPITDIINNVCKDKKLIVNFIFLDNSHPTTGLFATIAMLIGFILNFFGIKLFRFVIACFAFIISALSAYIILINVHLHAHNFGTKFDHVIGVGVLAAGVLGALLSGWIWKWILLGVGAFGGVALGLIIFSGLNASHLPDWLRPVLIGLLAISGAILLKKFERPLIIFATSITGALLFSFGLDAFIATGFDLIILTILSGTVDPAKIAIKERQVYGMVLLWIGLTVIGIAIQSKFTGKNIKSVTRH